MLLFENETYKIIGACMHVHKTLGHGFLESVYQEALEKEFRKQNIPFESQKKLFIMLEGEVMNKTFKADFICYSSVIIEIKAVSYLVQDFQKQTINYLKATSLPVGLLINFGEPSLKWKRFINTTRSV